MKVLISGASGRMSKRIISLMAKDKDIKSVYGLEKKGHNDVGKKLSDIIGIRTKKINNRIADDIKVYIEDIDVIVEFTTPQATLAHLKEAERYKKAIVIGTTGLSEKQFETIKEASLKIPVFYSPNMSIGVNIVFDLLEKISKNLPTNYNVEIIETHHKFKEDAPSGTAKRMAQIIAGARKLNMDKSLIYGRKGHTGKRPDKQICIHAVRGGSVIGRHQVKFIGNGDEIELIHNASSRDIFARGAILAVKFIREKKKGFYSTKDIINKDRT